MVKYQITCSWGPRYWAMQSSKTPSISWCCLRHENQCQKHMQVITTYGNMHKLNTSRISAVGQPGGLSCPKYRSDGACIIQLLSGWWYHYLSCREDYKLLACLLLLLLLWWGIMQVAHVCNICFYDFSSILLSPCLFCKQDCWRILPTGFFCKPVLLYSALTLSHLWTGLLTRFADGLFL